jgi:hypothetical protein
MFTAMLIAFAVFAAIVLAGMGVRGIRVTRRGQDPVLRRRLAWTAGLAGLAVIAIATHQGLIFVLAAGGLLWLWRPRRDEGRQ